MIVKGSVREGGQYKVPAIKKKYEIVHIITGLNTGGAEMMLYKLLSASDRTIIEPIVISLLPCETPIASKIKGLGIKVHSLNISKNLKLIKGLLELNRILKIEQVDLIQGWMYHGNFLAYLVHKKMDKKCVLTWNIRQSLYDINKEKKLTKHIIKINAKLSKKTNKIIFNSYTSMEQHQNSGFDCKKSIIIANGFELENYRYNEETRQKYRDKYKIISGERVIGMVARYHPMKDHANFVRAASALLSKTSKIKFILVGKGINWDNLELATLINDLGLRDSFILIDEVENISELMSMFDMYTLTSWAEAFPNVLGEAMLCERVCVTTDVGDAAHVVGETGFVVESANHNALADAWLKVLNMTELEREELGKLARQRIVSNYSLVDICKQYDDLYLELINDNAKRVF